MKLPLSPTHSLTHSLSSSVAAADVVLSLIRWCQCSRSGMGNRRGRRCLLHYLTMDFWQDLIVVLHADFSHNGFFCYLSQKSLQNAKNDESVLLLLFSSSIPLLDWGAHSAHLNHFSNILLDVCLFIAFCIQTYFIQKSTNHGEKVEFSKVNMQWEYRWSLDTD